MGQPPDRRCPLPVCVSEGRLSAVNMEEMSERLESVRALIDAAADRAGRLAAEVRVLPITKGHSVDIIRQVAAAGFAAVGESRVVEAAAKQAELKELGLRWHMVGHLQRNKAAEAVDRFDVIESVDSLRLAERLQRVAESRGAGRVSILAQVNTSGEPAKGGFRAAEIVEVVGALGELDRLEVRGLMTMAPFTEDERILRRTFSGTREALDRCATELGFAGRTLSMGMSNDFEIAVEEGSTELRLGTVLLGERAVQ